MKNLIAAASQVTEKQSKMGEIAQLGRALLRHSTNTLKRPKAFAAYGFRHDIPAAASTRMYTSTTKSLSPKGLKFRNSNLRSNLSRDFLLIRHKPTTRYMTSVTDKIENLVQNNKVVVFSKSYCPFCVATKNLFQTMNVDAEVLELDLMGKEGDEIQMALFQLTNQRSVPNVFVGGKHVGGNDDTQLAAKQGKLQEWLK